MTYGLGHPINDRVQCTEVDPPIYVWESRPNPAIVVILLPAQRLIRLVGSFPEARPVLGEANENLCVGG